MDQTTQILEAEKKRLQIKIDEVKLMLGDPTLEQMAREEIEKLEKEIENLDGVINSQGVTESEETPGNDFKSMILEARPGVGGDEAKIWANDLLRMYSRYASIKGWKIELLDDGVIKLSGNGVFDALKWENGVHRVQRVPETESAGRIHTSTASIVILPVVAETQILIRDDDLEWQFVTGGGHGGQNVNKVATAVRLTHKPSGIVVQARQERSQEQNRKIALTLLRSQLWEAEEEKKRLETSTARLAIGRSMRSEKIRTYNYPQNRVTDHRIMKSWHQLDRIMEGDLENILEAMHEL
jgi:peptide chain release factor 1